MNTIHKLYGKIDITEGDLLVNVANNLVGWQK